MRYTFRGFCHGLPYADALQAARSGEDGKIAQILLDRGAYVSAQSRNYGNALHGILETYDKVAGKDLYRLQPEIIKMDFSCFSYSSSLVELAL